jgi:hypothetical protein
MNQPAAAFRLVLLTTCMLAPVAQPVAQADWISQSELRDSCDAFVSQPYSLEGSSCLAFLQGFLLGAGRTTVSQDSTKPPAAETFTERAIRTRLGSAQIQRVNNSASPRYCIDENTPVAELMEAIRDHLDDPGQDSSLASPDTLQQALARSFPCDE